MSQSAVKKNETGKDLLQGFCAALYIFPLSLAVGAISGVGVLPGCLAGIVGCLLCAAGKTCYTPCWMLFMPAFFMIKEFGTGFAFAAMLTGSILFALFHALSAKKQFRFELTDAAKAGLAVGAAFLATVILTKDYFGIAASGNTAIEMLRSYRSNGFHANWRGVLYGTITLVIMITWPRKFRTFKKYLPAPFMAILIPLLFNMLLNREAYRTPVYEVGAYSFADFGRLFDFSSNVHSWFFLPLAGVGFAVCMIVAASFFGGSLQSEKGLSAAHICCSPVCLPLQEYMYSPKTALGGIIGALTVSVLVLLTPLIERVPLPSLAVVLITLGWQSVPWGLIKKAFQQGFRGGSAFVLCVLCFVFADPIAAFVVPFASFFDRIKENRKS